MAVVSMVGPAHIVVATLLPVLSGSSDRAASIAALIVVVLARRGARARCLALISTRPAAPLPRVADVINDSPPLREAARYAGCAARGLGQRADAECS